jgi:hypothetical protein
MKTQVIILKGPAHSGKKTLMQEWLPLLLHKVRRCYSIQFRNIPIYIFNTCVHGNRHWPALVQKMVNGKHKVYVIGAHPDDLIGQPNMMKRPLEEVLREEAPAQFAFHIVELKIIDSPDQEKISLYHEARARKVAGIIETVSDVWLASVGSLQSAVHSPQSAVRYSNAYCRLKTTY